ncbi:hypothetical protein BDV32DRAFT_147529 [Aspergillus pseudonomiae]|nr:hypothetical protein BDV32DRAFT_147529 [Aspergillus pseudonomiae]
MIAANALEGLYIPPRRHASSESNAIDAMQESSPNDIHMAQRDAPLHEFLVNAALTSHAGETDSWPTERTTSILSLNIVGLADAADRTGDWMYSSELWYF